MFVVVVVVAEYKGISHSPELVVLFMKNEEKIFILGSLRLRHVDEKGGG